LFLLFGTALGAWTSRIPAVKSRLGLTDGRLSIALLTFAVGAIIGMVLLGRLVDRFGSGRVMTPMALGEGALLVAPGYMPNLITLAVALFAFGLVHGTLNIAMNANAIEVQRAWRQPIMSSFHAVYSIGGFLGAAVGGLFARGGLSAGTTFVAVGCAVVAMAVWAARWALPSALVPAARTEIRPNTEPDIGRATEPNTEPNTGPVGGPDIGSLAGPVIESAAGSGTGPDPQAHTTTDRAPQQPGPAAAFSSGLWFLGMLAMFALVGEGTAADWSAVYLHESLHSSAGFAAVAFAAFSVMMTVGRLLGDRLAMALGPVLLVRASGVLASAGMLVALLVDRPIAGVVGFACLGAGMSSIAPQVYSAAGNRDPAKAGRALSHVVSLGYVGFLLGPIVIGSVSTAIGLPKALAIPALLVLVVAVGASALRPPPSVADTPPDRPDSVEAATGSGGDLRV